MNLKTLTILLASLASTTLATPTPLENTTTDATTLEARSTGVWLDLYHEGNCNSGWQDQPKSG
ncbi:hypothetical protein BJX70DRAFT_364168 [Aspergillus crustosus]